MSLLPALLLRVVRACVQNLTKSFGWNAHDSFVQHDVQEVRAAPWAPLHVAALATGRGGDDN